jgi:hypothetical protein
MADKHKVHYHTWIDNIWTPVVRWFESIKEALEFSCSQEVRRFKIYDKDENLVHTEHQDHETYA